MTRSIPRLAAAGLAGCLAAGLLGAEASAQTTVTMWTFLDPAKTSPREIALDQMIDDFEAANSDLRIRVEPQDFAQMPPRFYLGHRTGNNPDIVWIDAKNLGGLHQVGAGADMEELIVNRWSDADRADFFVEAGWEAGRHEGKLVALPIFHGASVIYYRKDLLEEAGIDPASLTSWDALRDAAKALTRDVTGDGRVDVWGFGMPLAPIKTESTPVLIGLLDQDAPVFEGCKANYASDVGVRAIEYTAGLIEDGVTPQDALVLDVDDITDQYAAGRYAIAITSILRYSVIARNATFDPAHIGVMAWPSWSGERSGPMPVSGWWVAIWENSPRKAEAARFVDYMVGPEGIHLWTTVGGQIPTRASLMEDEYFSRPENAWVQTMIDAWSTNSWIEPTECNTRTLQAGLNEAVARVVLEGMDPMAALREAEEKFADAQ